MKITKITEEFNLYEEQGIYYLAFGVIKKGVNTTARLRFEGVDSNLFSIEPTCQCTTSVKNIINDHTVENDISINTTGQFIKTVKIKNGKETKYLKLTGTVK